MQIEDSIEGDQESRNKKKTQTQFGLASFHYRALFKQIERNGIGKIFTSNE